MTQWVIASANIDRIGLAIAAETNSGDRETDVTCAGIRERAGEAPMEPVDLVEEFGGGSGQDYEYD